jgi:hypothetical protein
LGLVGKLIGGVTTPLIEEFTAKATRLLSKLALFFVAALCMAVVLIALTVAFDLWISGLYGPVAGALAVAGLYLAVALAAVATALLIGHKPAVRAASAADADPVAGQPSLDAQIDAFARPLLRTLRNLGLRREVLAVLAGTSVAKQMGPLPLVGLAIVAGFLVGRMAGGLRRLISPDLIGMLAKSELFAGLFRPRSEPADVPEEREAA